MKKLPPGTHAVPLGRGWGEQPIGFHTPDGRTAIGSGIVEPGPPGDHPESNGTVFVPCDGAKPWERVYHTQESGRRGPPRVNSWKYCEEYERIFGHSGPRVSSTPRRDKPN